MDRSNNVRISSGPMLPVLGRSPRLEPCNRGGWDISPDGSQIAIPKHDPRKATNRLVPLDASAGTAKKVVTITTLAVSLCLASNFPIASVLQALKQVINLISAS